MKKPKKTKTGNKTRNKMCNKKSSNCFKSKKWTKSHIQNFKPQKIRTLKEALQVCLNKETTIKDENNNVVKVTFLEALASKIISDAISQDGPTRRLLLRQDILNLVVKEQEIEILPDEQEIAQVEREYGELLLNWAKLSPETREKTSRILSEIIIDICNEKAIKGELKNG